MKETAQPAQAEATVVAPPVFNEEAIMARAK